jgi:hypothetical protein
MGPGAGQVTTQAATLESKGLISDVLLESRPETVLSATFSCNRVLARSK